MTLRRVGQSGVVLGFLALLVTIPPVNARSLAVPLVLAALAAVAGGAALVHGERALGGYAVAAGAVGGLLGWAATSADRSTVTAIVTAGLFASMLRYATPLLFAGLGGLFAERSGVTNIGLEGMMLTGAFFGVLCGEKSGSWVVGLVGAAIAGGLLALVHAFFSIHLQADQIISGTAINILATGGTAYLFRAIYGTGGYPEAPRIPEITIPGLAHVPLVGGVFGTLNLMIWVVFALLVAAWFFVFRTPWGLRLRAVGEHPRAADTVGINVYRVRYVAVVSSGVLAALGGAYLSFGLLSSFSEGMTAGTGFIALAALIFGKWRPLGLFGAALLFGLASALGNSLQSIGTLSVFWLFVVQVLPYALTLIAVVGLVGRSIPPAAVGRPYAKR